MPRSLALVLPILVALAIAPVAGASPVRGVQLPVITGTTSTSYLLDQLSAASAVHAQMVRTEVVWSALEPQAKGRRDPAYLAQVDAVVDRAAKDGIQVLLTLASTPCWASTQSDCSRAFGFPPRKPGDYADIAAFLASRYKGHLAALEIWNEPDHASEFYFGGPDKPARYAAIVRATYPAVKKASPQTRVLAGSLVGADGAFLEKLYAKGMKGYYDGLSVHYYDLVLASLRAIRAVQLKHGDHKPLWLAEFGWTSCFPGRPTQGGHICVSPARQAQDLVDTFGSLRSTPWVDAAVVYDIQDDATYQFGLLDHAGAHKPSYAAMSSVFSGTVLPVRPITLGLTRAGPSVIAAGSAPAGDVLEVTVRTGGRLRFKGTFRLDRDGAFSLRLPPALGTHGLTVRIRQLWSGKSAVRSI